MKKLKDIVADEKLVEKLNDAFSDLRADFELDLETSKENIEKLLDSHVNTKDHLELLTSVAKTSSGVLQGLRGTGKTHLMLLARHKINKEILDEKNLCIYVNLKRFNTIDNPSTDVFNRCFSANIFANIIDQLIIELESREKKSWFKRLASQESRNQQDFIEKVEKAIFLAAKAATEYLSGNSELEYLSTYRQSIKKKEEAAWKAATEIRCGLSLDSITAGARTSATQASSNSSQASLEHVSASFLDVRKVHDDLKEIVRAMGLRSIIFFFDEWEKLYDIGNFQKYSATFINSIIDTPIYAWVAYVPYRGELRPLSIGGDLQHSIDLDTDLIIEKSKSDRQNCINYFTDFINKRLSIFIEDPDIKCNTLINTNKKMELLILGSMGNTRDFGTILLAAWQNYKGYRQGKLKQGKPYQYISETHIKDAIKSDGKKKIQNIKSDAGALAVWNNIIDFITEKKHSHFSVQETSSKQEALSEREFSELFYQRLLHTRKLGVEPKDSSVGSKLSILAPSYSVTYEYHSKITYIKDSQAIDSRIRRYIYDPEKVIKHIRIKEGRIQPCITCDSSIDAGKMNHAWKQNTCPYCGGKIYNG